MSRCLSVANPKGILLQCNGANYNLDMYIINEQVVNNDGRHELEEKDGTVSLTAGVHFITVTYFENRFSEELQVKWTPTP